jgi:hypothetical protein
LLFSAVLLVFSRNPPAKNSHLWKAHKDILVIFSTYELKKGETQTKPAIFSSFLKPYIPKGFLHNFLFTNGRRTGIISTLEKVALLCMRNSKYCKEENTSW